MFFCVLTAIEPAAVGTTVMVPVPYVDRGRCEFRNIKAVVLECMSNGLYKLGTKHGVLKQAYSRNQFTPVKQSFLELAEVLKDREVGVQEVAREDSLGTGQGFVKCGCKTGCENGRCKCKANKGFV